MHISHDQKSFKLRKKGPIVVGSKVFIGVIIDYAFFHSMCDLKATQMNIRCSLIQKFILYAFEGSHNTVETTKTNICAKVKVCGINKRR